MAKHLHNIALVAITTMGSRVLGLFRDGLMIALLGTTPAAAAFLFAFTVPNLFRRLLGEGALTSAFIPIFTDGLQKDGRDAAFVFARKVATRTLQTLAILSIVGMLLYWGAHTTLHNYEDRLSPDTYSRWSLGMQLGALLLPYMAFVCLAALYGAMLNVLGRFGIHAISSVWLNLSIIAAMLIGDYYYSDYPTKIAACIAVGVLFGGIIQIIVPTMALKRQGFSYKYDPGPSPRLSELHALFLPALAGAAIMQVNVLVSRLFSFGLSDEALPALYLAGRLIEMPLGVFAIAIATVLFPDLSLHAAAGNRERLQKTFIHGLRMILAITLPAAVGLAVLSAPILRLLFEWGRFSASDIAITQPVLLILSLALPCYGLASYVTRAYHAQKDTRTPVKVATWCFAANLVGCAVLVFPLGVMGLALANLVSAIVQATLLVLWLPDGKIVGMTRTLGQIGTASIAMAAVCFGGLYGIENIIGQGKLADVTTVATLIPTGILIYFASLWLLKFEERHEVVAMLKAMLGKR